MMRKKYSTEFKLKIIELIEKEGNKIPQIADKYSIEDSIIRRWIREYKSSKNSSDTLFPGNGKSKNMENKMNKKNAQKLLGNKNIIKDSKILLKKKSTLKDYFEFIYNNKEKYQIIQMVEIFNINRSSYYKWVKKNKIWEKDWYIA